MNISIRDNIISNIKEENTKSLIAIIDETILNDDEVVLPGLGVMLTLFWEKLTKEEKEHIANIILKKIK